MSKIQLKLTKTKVFLFLGIISLVGIAGSIDYYKEQNCYELISDTVYIQQELMSEIDSSMIDVTEYIKGNSTYIENTILDIEDVNIKEVGNYSAYFIVENVSDKILEIPVYVRDTVAPTIEVLKEDINIELSKENPTFELRLDNYIDYSDYSDIQEISLTCVSLDYYEVAATSETLVSTIDTIGEFEFIVNIKDVYDNLSELSFVINISYDYESFVGELPTFSIYEGEPVDLSSGLSYEYPFTTFKVDDANVDYNTTGNYPIYYTFYTKDNIEIKKESIITISKLITVDSILSELDPKEYPITIEGTISVDILNSFLYYWDLIPDSIQDGFYQNGWELVVTTKTIRGNYYFGDTAGNIVGVCVYDDKTIYIYAYAQAIILVHEMGHYFDYINSFISGKETFLEIYNTEKDTFVGLGTSLTSYGVSSVREFFAEIFMNVICFKKEAKELLFYNLLI